MVNYLKNAHEHILTLRIPRADLAETVNDIFETYSVTSVTMNYLSLNDEYVLVVKLWN